MRRISEFIQVINQERHVRLFHLVFHEFTKVKDYTSVFNVVRHPRAFVVYLETDI